VSVTLEKHPVWDELAKLVTQIDAESLARQHLAKGPNKLRGYWDGDEHYEEIMFTSPLRSEFVSLSLQTPTNGHQASRHLTMTFLLKGDTVAPKLAHHLEGSISDDDDDEVGELVLTFNQNMSLVDENWLLDIDSPYICARK
jgi:hypothetical protein